MTYIDDDIIKRIKCSFEQQKEVNQNWSKYAAFVYSKTLSKDDVAMLEANDRDTFDFNIVRPFIWKSLKNVLDSSISTSFRPAVDDENMEKMKDTPVSPKIPLNVIADILNKKYETIQKKSGYDDMVYQVATDVWIGGKGVIKVTTEYENKYNFSQGFKMERCINPTKVYFDNKSKDVTKKDGDYAFEVIALTEEEFKKEYPSISFESVDKNWQGYGQAIIVKDQGSDKKMVNIIEYYYKDIKETKLYQLNNLKITEKRPANDSSILKTRKIKDSTIMMQRFVGNIELTKPAKTNFKSLPYIMVMGERYFDNEDREFIYPFAKHAFDGQRVKNLVMNFFLYDALNNRTSTVLMPEECETDDTTDAVRSPTIKKIIRYKGIQRAAITNEPVLLKPEIIPSQPLPTQYLEAFNAIDATIEATLGAKMPSLDDTNMSGKALYNLTQYISASNEQFMQHLQKSVVQTAKVILEAMPKVLEEEMFKMGDGNEEKVHAFDFVFETSLVNIEIQPGVDNKLQQQATIETIMDFAKENQTFAQFLNTPEAITLILSNLDLNNKDKLMAAWDKYIEDMQKQQNKPNPELQIEEKKAEANLMNAQTRKGESHIKATQIGMEQKNKEHDRELEMHKIKSENQRNITDNTVKMAQTSIVHKKNMLDHAFKIHGGKSNAV